MTTELRKWLAFGTGVGIEIQSEEIHASIVRVRPSGIAVLGSATVTEYRTRPAGEWGAELSGFLRKLGSSHIAATVLLPRRDVIVRTLNMPGVSGRDLETAISLQIDTLHPFAEDDVHYSWGRIPHSTSVLIGIVRKEVLERYTTLFAEAGLSIASFTFSAAVLYSALRVGATPPASGFVSTRPDGSELEVYGESETHPVFSASLDVRSGMARAVSELRLPVGTESVPIEELLPKPVVFPADHDPSTGGLAQHVLPYATALVSACPWLAVSANLLPAEQRRGSSKLRLAPTVAMASILLILTGALAAQSSYEDRKYLELLQKEITRLEPQARRAGILDRAMTETRARTQLIDDIRRRSKADMDVLQEVTKLIAPPGWVNSLDIDRSTVQVAGEVEQAAGLLKTFDGSRLFEETTFTMPIARVGVGESFRIRAAREGAPAK